MIVQWRLHDGLGLVAKVLYILGLVDVGLWLASVDKSLDFLQGEAIFRVMPISRWKWQYFIMSFLDLLLIFQASG